MGDPTTSGSFNPCPVLDSEEKWDYYPKLGIETAGYVNSLGIDQLRHVIAKFHSTWERTIVNEAMNEDDEEEDEEATEQQHKEHKQRSIKRPPKIMQQSQTQDDKYDLQQQQQPLPRTTTTTTTTTTRTTIQIPSRVIES